MLAAMLALLALAVRVGLLSLEVFVAQVVRVVGLATLAVSWAAALSMPKSSFPECGVPGT